jgi:hypothetical protein
MKKTAFLISICLSFLSLCAIAENRAALIVGCDYKGTALELPSPAKDAAALATALGKVGFPKANISLLTNPTRQELVQACDRFHEKLKASGGVGLFYFSGHGAQVDGTNYLIPSKAAIKFREHLKTEGLPASYIATNMEAADNGINILILDACRNNPLPSAKKKAFAPKGLARMDGDGILFCFAAKDGQEALDTGKGSVYTNALIANIATPNVGILTLLTKVRKDVKALTENQQEPFFYSGLDDPFVFLSSSSRKIPTPPAPAPQITATKEKPFSNSLGMKFAPVKITGGPTDGKNILFSIWETRRMDYEAYSKDVSGVDDEWKSAEGNEALHPVVNVSWEDATAFCAWLTRKERAEGKIGPKDEYRLPSDHEWSCAIGIGSKENAGTSLEDKDSKLPGYPWGNSWPPPNGAGNFGSGIAGYSDAYDRTAPVGSFSPSSEGLYDLSGNVWEWCQDWYSSGHKYRVLRGGSWYYDTEILLRSSYRFSDRPPRYRFAFNGFRCVLSVG